MSTGNGKKLKTKTDDIRATDLRFERGRLIVLLADGREVSVPLLWYPTLHRASSSQRARWRLIGRGLGIHWNDLDLDLSIEGIVNGLREYIPKPPRLASASGSAQLRTRRSA